jgi:hypothetical protein
VPLVVDVIEVLPELPPLPPFPVKMEFMAWDCSIPLVT